jgi:hypothetical protein
LFHKEKEIPGVYRVSGYDVQHIYRVTGISPGS